MKFMSYKTTYSQQLYLDELKAFHFDECPTVNWEKEAKEPFPQGSIGPNEKVWTYKEENFDSNFLSNIIGLNNIITSYYRFKRKRAEKKDNKIYDSWMEKHPFAKSMLDGNLESWRYAVNKYAKFHQNRNIAIAYSIHLYNYKIVECDVYLHDMEKIIPNKLEKVTKRGKIRYHEMPKTKRYELYQQYVYSCLNKITNDLLAVLPCNTVFINGAIGSEALHHPIISAVIDRKQHRQVRCPQKTIKRHRYMAIFKQRSGFYPLKTVYAPKVLFVKED